MSERNKVQSRSTTNLDHAAEGWTGTQAYVLAAFCLVLGVALGYLYRGSASQAGVSAVTSSSAQQESASQKQPGAAEAQAALAQTVAPYIDAVKKDPNDYDALVKLGNLYYDGQRYPDAIQYYERALKIHPENADVRTDMGTAYWYAGDADRAIEEMQTSLKYRPGHPQTLFNLGWIRWQGKGDPKGAVAAWQQLLKANPDYPQKQQVEQYIAKAKEHAARG